MMIRLLYIFVLRLHPPSFRRRFASEMLWIFDQEPRDQGAVRLLADAFLSLLRQWVLRPHVHEQPLATGTRSPYVGVPSLRTLEDSSPLPSALLNGGVLTVALFGAVTFVIGLGGGKTSATFIGSRHPRPHVLPVDRSSILPRDPTTEIRIQRRDDPWHRIASVYFKVIFVLRALDADEDLILSPEEISNAPFLLRNLDWDSDGKLSPEECGHHLRDASDDARANGERLGSRLDPQFVKRTGLAFMRFNPVLATLDADQNGEISLSEMDNGSQRLKRLDRNRDGSLTMGEIAPDPAANEAAHYLSRLDQDADGRIVASERLSDQAEQLRELLDDADQDRDGVVTTVELTNELRIRIETKNQLENAVRLAPRSTVPAKSLLPTR